MRGIPFGVRYARQSAKHTARRNRSFLAHAHIDQVITNAAPLPFPLEAKLDSTGEAVTLLSTCDWHGQSPANIGVDARRKQLLAAFDEVTDHRAVPNPAVDAIRTGRAASESR